MSPSTSRKIVRMYREGWMLWRICKDCRCGAERVYAVLREAGVTGAAINQRKR